MKIPEIVEMYMDSFCHHDIDAFFDTFAPDGTYSDPGTDEPISGQAIKDYLGGLLAAYPDAIFETVALHVITENLVVWRWIMYGINTGTFAGRPPTGRHVTLPGCDFIEVVDSKIQRVEGYHERLTLLQQRGLLPAPPQK